MVKFTRKQSRQAKQATEGMFKAKPLLFRFIVSPITKNLFADGMYDGEKFEAFLTRGKAGWLSGFIVVCDALGRRDNLGFAYAVAAAAKFNKVKPL